MASSAGSHLPLVELIQCGADVDALSHTGIIALLKGFNPAVL